MIDVWPSRALLVLLIVAIVAGVSCFSTDHSANLLPNSETQSSPSPDFSIAASPNNIVQNGANFNSQIKISSLNGFIGTVDLSSTTNSTNFSCTLSPKSISGGSGNSYLSCNSSASGTYLATVTGTSGTLSHSTTVTEYYPPSNVGFVIWTSPGNITDTVEDSGYVNGVSDVTVIPLVTFQSGVSLTFYTNSTHLACNLTPNTYFPAGTGGDTGLWCTADAAGNYLAVVTAQGGIILQSVTVTYHIQDFILTTGPQSLTVDTGSTGTTTITFSPLNGFNMNVTLSLSNYSPRLFCSLSQTVMVGGSGTATLLCNGNTPGNYVAIVTTTAGHRTQTLAFSYNVQNPSIFGVSPAGFYAAIIIATASVLIATFLLMRRRRLGKPTINKQGTLAIFRAPLASYSSLVS